MKASKNEVLEAGSHFEARVDSVVRNKSGAFLRIEIHPDEVPVDILALPHGQRLMVVMVPINDESEPEPTPPRRESNKMVAQSNLLPKSEEFQRWMFKNNLASSVSEDAAVQGIYEYCGIKSRSELSTKSKAQDLFSELVGLFSWGNAPPRRRGR